MKINLQLCGMLMMSVFIYGNAISQSKTIQEPLTIVVFGDNVDAPITLSELAKIQAVYGDNTEDILNRDQHIKDIKNILRNRVVVFDAGTKDLSSLPKLSQVALFNDFVPNLTRDLSFSPENFNPLKYKFDFYSRNSEIYWVDNTAYYIEIKSQHQYN
jgi:hypothetical protein